MKFLTVAVLFAAAAWAQDDTCDGAPVLESCLETTESQQAACMTNDFNCLCEKSTAVFGCFASAGCGNDVRASSYQNTMQSYCAYVTTTSAVSAATTATTASSQSSESSVSTTTTSTDSEATTAASEGDGESSGAYLAMNAGGMLAAVAGVVVAVL